MISIYLLPDSNKTDYDEKNIIIIDFFPGSLFCKSGTGTSNRDNFLRRMPLGLSRDV